MAPTVGSVVAQVLGPDLPVGIEAYDGSRAGPPDPPTTIEVRSPDALHRMLTAPGELGLARAYVAGDLEVRGELWPVLELRHRVPGGSIGLRGLVGLARLLTTDGLLLRRLPPPPEEVRGHGHRHTRAHDASAIAHHYDVSNDFYRLVLGPTMTYSCAVFAQADDTLETAQDTKHELICGKLGLRPGMRLLDIGCGWGAMAIHAARRHGTDVVGVTVSDAQAERARQRVREAGLADHVEIRLEDYRDVDDGPYDAISSIGMFEHVGLRRLGDYFGRVCELLAPHGRFVNHAISRPDPHDGRRLRPRGFFDRYIFPDAELHEVGTVVSAIQAHDLEVRHVEGLREHYARTLRHWLANLEHNWDDAVTEAGLTRARIWRLYLALSAVGFDDNLLHVDQVLAVRTTDTGSSGFPLRPDWSEPRHRSADETPMVDLREPAGSPR